MLYLGGSRGSPRGPPGEPRGANFKLYSPPTPSSRYLKEIDALEAGIKALDKSVAEATETRKEENAEYKARPWIQRK